VSSASSAATAGARPGQVGYQDAAHQRYSHSQQQSHPLSQVYSFVPIPGAQQHKRPRRRYEEIERMYKCGWNGCEKAYGTLNHLNAHVTMQSHGSKRTPEGEFVITTHSSLSSSCHFPISRSFPWQMFKPTSWRVSPMM
jgi:hypothetical protein